MLGIFDKIEDEKTKTSRSPLALLSHLLGSGLSCDRPKLIYESVLGVIASRWAKSSARLRVLVWSFSETSLIATWKRRVSRPCTS